MMNGKPLAHPALRFPLSAELENSFNTNTFIVTSWRVSHQVDERFALLCFTVQFSFLCFIIIF